MDTKREHRTHAEGSPRGKPCDLTYSPSGRLTGKYRVNSSVARSASANMVYGYCDNYQPHAVKRMFDYNSGLLYDMRWDGAGNLGQVSMATPGEMVEASRFLFWTEDSAVQGERRTNSFVFPSQNSVGVANWMHTAVDDRYYSYYTYDHSGERRLKLVGANNLLDVNAEYMSTISALDKPTLYPSAYLVLTNKGYTIVAKVERRASLLALPRRSNVTERKHYYAGTERVAARLSGGGLNGINQTIGNDDALQAVAGILFGQCLKQANDRVLLRNDLDCIGRNDFAKDEFCQEIYDIPSKIQAEVNFNHNQLHSMMNAMLVDHGQGNEPDVYFYHSDHLGSASWITDNNGNAVQHLQYLPYGEPYINQRLSGYNERFTFSGKGPRQGWRTPLSNIIYSEQRDEETGYGYFGARYMDHDQMTMWLSVDPMSDKYPSISPYAYCAWNPVKLVDPDGCEIGDYYSLTGYYLGWDGHFDNKIYIMEDKTSLEKDPNGYVNQSKVAPLVSATYETLSATVGVFNRTQKNGGGKEESTAVIAECFSIQGNTGYTSADGNPHCDFPTLEEDQQLLGVTSIHSHPFIAVGMNGYHNATPSDDDKALFGLCNMNIIVGYTSTPTERSIYPYSTDNIGAAFFDSASRLKTAMSMRSIEKIVNNRQNAMINHFKQIANRP